MPRTKFFIFGYKVVLQRLVCFVLVISLSSLGTPKTSVYIPDMVHYTFSQSIILEVSSLEGELKCNLKQWKRLQMLPKSGERLSGLKNIENALIANKMD